MRLRYGLAALGIAAATCLLADAILAAEVTPPPQLADMDTAPCRSHPDMDLEAYVAAYSVPGYRDYIPSPTNQLVPKDVVIEGGPAKFTTIRPPGHFIRGSVPAYMLPIRDDDDTPLTDDSDKWQGDSFFPNGEVLTFPCRVRDPSGKQWLVRRNDGGVLSYYNFDRFKPFKK